MKHSSNFSNAVIFMIIICAYLILFLYFVVLSSTLAILQCNCASSNDNLYFQDVCEWHLNVSVNHLPIHYICSIHKNRAVCSSKLLVFNLHLILPYRLKKPQTAQQMNKQKPIQTNYFSWEDLFYVCVTNTAQSKEQGLFSLQLCLSSPESFISQIFKSYHHWWYYKILVSCILGFFLN